MQHIGFVGALAWMGHGKAKNSWAKGFDLSMSVQQRTGYGREVAPSLFKVQAQLKQVKIGQS